MGAFAVGYCYAAERHGIAYFGAIEFPGIATLDQPLLRLLDLPSFRDVLAKQTVLVTDSIAVGRDTERGHRIHEAGRQPAQSPVAQCGVRFLLQDFVQFDPEVLQRRPAQIGHAQVEHRVRQQPADQEFHRQVIHALDVRLVDALGRRHPPIHQALPHGQRQRHAPVSRHSEIGVLADRIHEPLEDALFEVFFLEDRYHGSVLQHHALQHDVRVADQADDLAVFEHRGA